jgi:hypothetical protein
LDVQRGLGASILGNNIRRTVDLLRGNAVGLCPAGIGANQVSTAGALQRHLAGTTEVIAQSAGSNRSTNICSDRGRCTKLFDQIDRILFGENKNNSRSVNTLSMSATRTHLKVVVLLKTSASSVLGPLVVPKRIVGGVRFKSLDIRPVGSHGGPPDFNGNGRVEGFLGAVLGVTTGGVLRPHTMDNKVLAPELLGVGTTSVGRLVVAKLRSPRVGKDKNVTGHGRRQRTGHGCHKDQHGHKEGINNRSHSSSFLFFCFSSSSSSSSGGLLRVRTIKKWSSSPTAVVVAKH